MDSSTDSTLDHDVGRGLHKNVLFSARVAAAPAAKMLRIERLGAVARADPACLRLSKTQQKASESKCSHRNYRESTTGGSCRTATVAAPIRSTGDEDCESLARRSGRAEDTGETLLRLRREQEND